MHYLNELKNFVNLHSSAQQLNPRKIKKILKSISTIDNGLPDNWSQVWSNHAQLMEERGKWAEACKLYNLARFPFIETAVQQDAHEACIKNFKLAMKASSIEFETLNLMNGEYKAYATGLDRGWPLLIVCGGIISIKEQWQRFMHLSAKLELAIAITEMPGVGENKQVYQAGPCTLFSTIINALSGRAKIEETHLMALSFSGHLAIINALNDPRIIGITTIGAPVEDFFSNFDKSKIPLVTQKTLAHIMQHSIEQLDIQMQAFGLVSQKVSLLNIPIHYLQSSFDEIISKREIPILRSMAPHLEVLEIADVHGSPNNIGLVSLWALSSILSSYPSKRKQNIILSNLLGMKMLWIKLKNKISFKYDS
ncbi:MULTISPECIES: alpha/beta hydrolase [unclassified Acinetobacter]|uniref:alpha/beta hydrolase n=1 Tax=unclassified Acinetobacter TaxID=196816 RepID=UPI0018EB5A09|nr:MULTISPECIES: alpha/beta hydrolase [unclassified Acinetobacter]MBJ6352992.1 alpha/beta hydrolase [Acinetobacter sp. c1]MBM0958611.1 alpha/beta hydrolase [Acinetobacter sp. C13]